MADVPFSTFVAGLAVDSIGGSEKLPLVESSTNKHVTPDLLAAYTIDQIHGATVITSLTDSHQLPVFTSGDDERIITFANVSAWVIDEIEAVTTGTSIVSGDTVLYSDGGVLKQIDIDTIVAFVNSENGTLGAQVDALSTATLADTDEYLVEQGGTARKATFSAIAARVHSQFGTYTAALDPIVTPVDADILYILDGGTPKYMTLTVLANTYLAAELNLSALQWPTTTTTPSLAGDKLLMERSGTISEVNIDTLVTYFSTGMQANILDYSGLTADTPAASDLFAFDDGDPKKITLANLETQFWTDFATYVGALTAVSVTAASDKFYCIQGGTPKYVTPAELATYFDVGTGDVSGPTVTTTNKIPQWDSTNKLLKDGLILVTEISESGSAVDTSIPTEQAVREALSEAATADLDIDGATAIGEALNGTDLFLVDHGANGTNRSSTIGRIKTYIETAGTYDMIYVDAAAMAPTATDGAAAGSVELGNGINLDLFAFDGGATEERAQFRLTMPEEWDRGNVKVRFLWSSAVGSTAGDTVEWGVKAVSISDSDVLNATFGQAQSISDTLLANNGGDLQRTEAVEITIGGSPQLGDMTIFEVYRNTDGTDDMAEDARLFGVQIMYRKNKVVSDWTPAVSSSPSSSASSSPSSSPSAS